jgi:hypothetical protein
MQPSLWIVLAITSLGGAAGCKDSNATLVFDAATATSTDGKGDQAAAKTDASPTHDDGAVAQDGTVTVTDGPPGDGALDENAPDGEPGP